MDKLSASDFAAISAMLMAMAFLVHVGITFVLCRIVALNEVPDRRAFWSTFPGYILVSIFFAFGLPMLPSPFLAPLIALPGALIIYWWLRRDFRKDWVENPDDLPDGIKLANNDWRIGLAGVVAIIVAATVRALLR